MKATDSPTRIHGAAAARLPVSVARAHAGEAELAHISRQNKTACACLSLLAHLAGIPAAANSLNHARAPAAVAAMAPLAGGLKEHSRHPARLHNQRRREIKTGYCQAKGTLHKQRRRIRLGHHRNIRARQRHVSCCYRASDVALAASILQSGALTPLQPPLPPSRMLPTRS